MVEGSGSIRGGAAADFLSRGEGDGLIDAGGGADRVVGGPGRDRIELGAGDDAASAGPGDDVMRGAEGNDWLLGEEGNDRLYGNAGSDVLVGGAGLDRVYAGAGDDTLVIQDACEAVSGELYAGGPGRDVLVSPLGLRELLARGVLVRDIEEIRIDTTRAQQSECHGGPSTVLAAYDILRPAVRDERFSVDLGAQVSVATDLRGDRAFGYEIAVKRGSARVVARFTGELHVPSDVTRGAITHTWDAAGMPPGDYTYGISLGPVLDPSSWNWTDLGDVQISSLKVSGTSPVCVVIGHDSANDQGAQLPLYGTDLGVPVTRRLAGGAQQNLLFFGDTWDTGITHSEGDNDALAAFTSADPASCLKLSVSRFRHPGAGGPAQFTPVHIDQQSLGDLVAPGAAFKVDRTPSGASDVYALYRTPDAPFCEATPVRQLVRQHDQVAVGFYGPSPWFDHVSFFDTSAGGGVPGCPYVHRFLNVAAATTANPDGTTRYVYVWGLRSYGLLGDPAVDALLLQTFLARIDVAEWPVADAPPPWRYWRGNGGEDVPGCDGPWCSDVALSVPVIDDEPQHAMNQVSVGYDATLGRWLMLYGGTTPEQPAKPSDGIYLRWAFAPQGPWSNPVTLWAPWSASCTDCCQLLFDPAKAGTPGCLPQTDLPPPVKGDVGAPYGAYLLPTQFSDAPGGGRTLRWLVSTWNPYHVVEMQTTITP